MMGSGFFSQLAQDQQTMGGEGRSTLPAVAVAA
jgi:hypothetical protein